MITRDEFTARMSQRWENILQKHTKFEQCDREEAEAKAWATVIQGTGSASAMANTRAATAESARIEAFCNRCEAIAQMIDFEYDCLQAAVEQVMARP